MLHVLFYGLFQPGRLEEEQMLELTSLSEAFGEKLRANTRGGFIFQDRAGQYDSVSYFKMAFVRQGQLSSSNPVPRFDKTPFLINGRALFSLVFFLFQSTLFARGDQKKDTSGCRDHCQ